MPLDWSQCPEVTRSPDIVSGAWVFRGTRLPVTNVFENLEAGVSVNDIPKIFQGVSAQQVRNVLHFAAQTLELRATAS